MTSHKFDPKFIPFPSVTQIGSFTNNLIFINLCFIVYQYLFAPQISLQTNDWIWVQLVLIPNESDSRSVPIWIPITSTYSSLNSFFANALQVIP